MPSKECVSYSINYCKDLDTAASFLVEFLYTVNLLALPLYRLRLKVRYLVILLRNLNLEGSLYNSTRLVILLASYKLLRCLILGTRRYGAVV